MLLAIFASTSNYPTPPHHTHGDAQKSVHISLLPRPLELNHRVFGFSPLNPAGKSIIQRIHFEPVDKSVNLMSLVGVSARNPIGNQCLRNNGFRHDFIDFTTVAFFNIITGT
jgi:hypothetical protein